MMEPAQALAVVRRELRDTVVPVLKDGYVKEQLIAAVGILGEVASQLQKWADMEQAARSLYEDLLGIRNSMPSGSQPSAPPSGGIDPAAWRQDLLSYAEKLMLVLSASGSQPWAQRVRRQLRAGLARDLARQLHRDGEA